MFGFVVGPDVPVSRERLYIALAGAVGDAPVERGEARERVGAEEVAREEIEDVVVEEVDPALDRVIAEEERRRVGDLVAVDRRLARVRRSSRPI